MPATDTDVLYIGSDLLLLLDGLTGVAPDGTVTVLNAATVTYALKDAAGATVAGGTGTLAYVAASSGNYAGVIDKAVTALLKRDRAYRIEVTIRQGTFDDFRVLDRIARYRGAT